MSGPDKEIGVYQTEKSFILIREFWKPLWLIQPSGG